MKKLITSIVLISVVYASSSLIDSIISNPDWKDSEANVKNVISTELLGQPTPDEVRADILNAKFEALNRRIEKITCIKNGSNYNFETELCEVPVENFSYDTDILGEEVVAFSHLPLETSGDNVTYSIVTAPVGINIDVITG